MTDTPETTYYYAKQTILPPEAKIQTKQQALTIGQKTQLALASREASHFATLLAIMCLALTVILLSMNKGASVINSSAAPTYHITNNYHYAAPQPTIPSNITLKIDDGGALKELASGLKTMFSNKESSYSRPTKYAPPTRQAAPKYNATSKSISIFAEQNFRFSSRGSGYAKGETLSQKAKRLREQRTARFRSKGSFSGSGHFSGSQRIHIKTNNY